MLNPGTIPEVVVYARAHVHVLAVFSAVSLPSARRATRLGYGYGHCTVEHSCAGRTALALARSLATLPLARGSLPQPYPQFPAALLWSVRAYLAAPRPRGVGAKSLVEPLQAFDEPVARCSRARLDVPLLLT